MKLLASLAATLLCACTASAQSVADYDSIQAAIDANPGRMIEVPAGDHELDRTIEINTPGTGLHGFGTIIQTNPDAEFLRIENTSDVRIEGLTMTRPEGAQDSSTYGVFIHNSERVTIDGVHIINCKTNSGAIQAADSMHVTIRDCVIRNYKRLWIDRRMERPEQGYSFQCIDGSGIIIRYCDYVMIEGNRVDEDHFVPSKENRDKYELGKIVEIREDPPPGRLVPKDMLAAGYTNNWHQGSAVVVTGLGTSRRIVIRGNIIRNAAQGIDLHTDNAIVSSNIVDGAMIGMKAMHGSRHTLIDGNQFLRFDLWGVLLQPGAGSHRVGETGSSGSIEQNVDGGSIVSNNIFSEIGQGGQRWNWEDHRDNDGSMLSAIVIGGGQLPENPPITDVIITGNVVYDAMADGLIDDDKVVTGGPEHKYALYLDVKGNPPPENVLIRGNLFDAGFRGVSNVPLD